MKDRGMDHFDLDKYFHQTYGHCWTDCIYVGLSVYIMGTLGSAFIDTETQESCVSRADDALCESSVPAFITHA